MDRIYPRAYLLTAYNPLNNSSSLKPGTKGLPVENNLLAIT